MPQHFPLLFGRFLVKTGWVVDAQLQQAAQLQKELTLSLGLTAILEGLLTVDELRQVIAYQRQNGLLFLEAVRQLRLLSEEQLATLENHCHTSKILLGEILVIQGSLSKADLQEAVVAFEHYKASGVLPSVVHQIPPGGRDL